MQYGDIGPAVAQNLRLLTDSAYQQFRWKGVRLGGVSVQNVLQHTAATARFHDQHQLRLSDTLGPPSRRSDRVQGFAGFVQQNVTGFGEQNLAAGTLEQLHAKPLFKLTDRT